MSRALVCAGCPGSGCLARRRGWGGAFVFTCRHGRDVQASRYLSCGKPAVPVNQCFGPGDPSMTAIPHKTNLTLVDHGLVTCWSDPRHVAAVGLPVGLAGAGVSQAWAAPPVPGAGRRAVHWVLAPSRELQELCVFPTRVVVISGFESSGFRGQSRPHSNSMSYPQSIFIGGTRDRIQASCTQQVTGGQPHFSGHFILESDL